MQLPKMTSERQPMVCLLSGLLLIAVALFLGLENSFAVAVIVIGLLCSAFGLILFVLQLQERPTKSAATRLSPDFISAGSTVQMPAMPNAENDQ
jgi:uncharacterized membrane protein HdeD (DUF308 family)